jgi:hypothetical protein
LRAQLGLRQSAPAPTQPPTNHLDACRSKESRPVPE